MKLKKENKHKKNDRWVAVFQTQKICVLCGIFFKTIRAIRVYNLVISHWSLVISQKQEIKNFVNFVVQILFGRWVRVLINNINFVVLLCALCVLCGSFNFGVVGHGF